MKIKNAHVTWECDTRASSATLEVPGLGNVEILNFLSDETRERIFQEAKLALESRLGIVCNFAENKN